MTTAKTYAASSEFPFATLLSFIRPGDRVYYTDRFSQVESGSVKIVPLPSDDGMQHVVLDIGGKHGTPKVVDAQNFQSFKPAKDRQEVVAQRLQDLLEDRRQAQETKELLASALESSGASTSVRLRV